MYTSSDGYTHASQRSGETQYLSSDDYTLHTNDAEPSQEPWYPSSASYSHWPQANIDHVTQGMSRATLGPSATQSGLNYPSQSATYYSTQSVPSYPSHTRPDCSNIMTKNPNTKYEDFDHREKPLAPGYTMKMANDH